VLGPLIGGFLTDSISWHWIFYVNMPLGAVALYIAWRYLPSVHGEPPTRNLDYAGAIVFAVGVFFLLLGLTNKQSAEWTDVSVGGYLLIAAALTPLFLWIESRAAEPIIPLELFRNRNYSVAILATFLSAIAFFGAIVFLPRWFQFVEEVSATLSGLYLLPLMGGVIIGSVAGGALVSMTGRYKWLVTGAMVSLVVGLFLSTGLTGTTELPTAWIWMFLCGLGVGPTLSVFTIVVQASVPFSRLGVATGNLTFFRQIGASVGLAIVGTVFADSFVTRLGPELTTAGVPAPVVGLIEQFSTTTDRDLTQVSEVSLEDQLAAIPALAGLVDQVVAGIHEAFSLAIADTFWVGLAVTLLAMAVAAIGLKDLPIPSLGRADASERAEDVEATLPPPSLA